MAGMRKELSFLYYIAVLRIEQCIGIRSFSLINGEIIVFCDFFLVFLMLPCLRTLLLFDSLAFRTLRLVCSAS